MRRRWWFAATGLMTAAAVSALWLWPRPPLPAPAPVLGRAAAMQPVDLTGPSVGPLDPPGQPVWTLPDAHVFVLGDLVVGSVGRGTRDSDLQAVDGLSGRIRWSLRWQNAEPGDVQLGEDPATLYAGTIVAGSGHRQRFHLTAIDVASGRTLWTTPVGGEHARSWWERASSDGEPPALVIRPGSDAIAVTAWASDGNRETYAFDPADGRPVDESDATEASRSEECETGAGLRVCAHAGAIVATDATTGAERWRTGTDRAGVTDSASVDSVSGAHVAVHTESSGHGTVLDARTGAVLRRGVSQLPTGAGNGFVLVHDLGEEHGDRAVGVHRSTSRRAR